MEKINVLIIDDEVTILNSFKAHFRKIYNVFTATNVDDGQQILDGNGIQVLLVDYNMPKKNGILYLSEVTLTNPNVSRILITAHDELKVAIEGVNFGNIYRYVQKPWDLDELKIIIDQSNEFYQLKKDNELLLERLWSNDKLIKLLEDKKQN
jgi:DNA-binding NtrC family response regulator